MLRTKEELLATLKDMQAVIEANDSFEGNISYNCMADNVEPGSGNFEVSATYRVGNSLGQGGVVMIQAAE